MILEHITDNIGNTPMLRLNRVMPDNGVDVLVKMEQTNPGGSIKDRPCLAMITEAEESGLIREGSTIIEPTTGNTGIGLAMICAVKGYRCVLTMPEDLSLERIYLFRNYGAEVILTPARHGVRGAIEKADALLQKTPDSFMPLQFKSRANPASHRRTTAIEILQDCEGKIDVFVAGVGTGGTITGVGEVLKKEIPGVQVVAVEPENCALLSGGEPGAHRIQGIGAGFVPEILNREIIDEIFPVSDRDAYEMMRRLGQKEGLCVGISSGANVHAALAIAAALGRGQRVVTILCDTGERYFSTEQYFEA